MREHRFVGLAVQQTPPGQISSVGRVYHRQAFPISKRAPAQVRDVGHELVHSRINEINELQLEDRPLAVRGQAARNTEDGRLSQRRIENLFRKLSRELLRQPENAAFGVFDIFAEYDSPGIILQTETQGLVDRVADPVFAGR